MKKIFDKWTNSLKKRQDPFSFHNMKKLGPQFFFSRIYKKINWSADPVLERLKGQVDDVDFTEGITLLSFDGISYSLHTKPSETIEYTAMKNGAWEINNIRLIDHFLNNKKGTFIDVGANIGAITIPLARKHPQIKFICFEPNPDVFSRLNKNIELNKLENVTTVPLLCSSDDNKTVSFFSQVYSNTNNNMGLSSVRKKDSLKDHKEIQVKSVSIDQYIKNHASDGNILGLKIDVEGHELDVLMGATNTLINNRPFLLCEFEGPHYTDAEYAKTNLLTIFNKYNYSLYAANFELYSFKPKLNLSSSFVGDYLAISDSKAE